MTFLSIIAVVIVFFIVILWHEFGHFTMAKLSGVQVNEFSIGMGPKITGTKRNGTTYSLRAIPIGGYVALEGEEEESENGNSFRNAPIWKRALIMLAGAVMNFILGFIVLIILFSVRGEPVPVILDFTEQSVAEEVGLEIGDRIVSIDDTDINTWEDLTNFMDKNHGEEISVRIQTQNNDEKMVSIKPTEMEGRYVLGIYPKMERMGIASSIRGAQEMFGIMFFSLMNFLRTIFQGSFDSSGLSGPLGVVNILVEAANQGILQILFWLAYININLGVINLLPLPALDGGKLIFLIVEAIRGKPVDPEKEGYVHFIGFVLLMGLMVFVTYQDIMRFLE